MNFKLSLYPSLGKRGTLLTIKHSMNYYDRMFIGCNNIPISPSLAKRRVGMSLSTSALLYPNCPKFYLNKSFNRFVQEINL
jgi:hypothetical protein